MTQSGQILEALEGSLVVFEIAKAERQKALQALCTACEVECWQDIEDHKLFCSACDLDYQIAVLDGLIGDLKTNHKYIKRSFRNI